MPIRSLYFLTVLTNKYGLTSLLQPWAQAWTKGLKDKLPGYTEMITKKPSLPLNSLEMLLWIAWELGQEQLFRAVYGYLVLNATVEEGHLVEENFKVKLFSTGVATPPAICDHIKAGRGNVISNIVGLFNSRMESFVFKRTRRGFRCTEYDDNEEYEAIMIGKFMRWLGRNKLWPLPDAGNVLTNGIRLATLATCSQLTRRHEYCLTFESDEIQSILDPMNISIPENFKTHLEMQAEKAGMD